MPRSRDWVTSSHECLGLCHAADGEAFPKGMCTKMRRCFVPVPRLIVRVAGHLLVDAFALFGGWRDDPVAGAGDQDVNSYQRISGDRPAVRHPHADDSGTDRAVCIRRRAFVHSRSQCGCHPCGCCVLFETPKQVDVEAARLEGPVYRPLLHLQLLKYAHRANRNRTGLHTWPA